MDVPAREQRTNWLDAREYTAWGRLVVWSIDLLMSQPLLHRVARTQTREKHTKIPSQQQSYFVPEAIFFGSLTIAFVYWYT